MRAHVEVEATTSHRSAAEPAASAWRELARAPRSVAVASTRGACAASRRFTNADAALGSCPRLVHLGLLEGSPPSSTPPAMTDQRIRPSSSPRSARFTRSAWSVRGLVAACALALAALSGCAGGESETIGDDIEDTVASIVELEEAAAFGPVSEEGPSRAGGRDASAPSGAKQPNDAASHSQPSPGDTRSEPEPDPWNPGADASKKFSPNDA